MSYQTPVINRKAETTSSNILQRIAIGDKSAVKECIDVYSKLVWGLARKYTNTKEDAEDAVQDIFIDIWKYAARFDLTKSPEGAFITLIARRRLIDRIRKSKNQPQISFSESLLDKQSSNADRKLQLLVEMKNAFQAINTFNEKQKQILQMVIYGGMSHSEIAKSVNLPIGTVKSQVRRGFQKIRSSIGLVESI